VAEGCFQHRIQYNGKRLGKRYFYRVSEGALQSFLVRFRGLFVLFTVMVFWCGGRLLSAPDSIQRVKVGKALFFIGFQKGR